MAKRDWRAAVESLSSKYRKLRKGIMKSSDGRNERA